MEEKKGSKESHIKTLFVVKSYHIETFVLMSL